VPPGIQDGTSLKERGRKGLGKENPTVKKNGIPPDPNISQSRVDTKKWIFFDVGQQTLKKERLQRRKRTGN